MTPRAVILKALHDLAIEHGEMPGQGSGALAAADHLRHGEVDQAIWALLRTRVRAMESLAWKIEMEIAQCPESEGPSAR